MERPLFVMIMAGGSGDRFWPLSRTGRPKQLLNLIEPDRSMLRRCVDQWLPFSSPERLFIAGNASIQRQIKEHLPDIPAENILAEPAKRNTSGCLAYAAAHFLNRFGDDVLNIPVAVVSADLAIESGDAFSELITQAADFVAATPHLLVAGVQPTRPETGYGYIEISGKHLSAIKAGSQAVARVRAFKEKPDETAAGNYLKSGRHFWNSGLLFFSLSTFLNEIQKYQPELHQRIRAMAEADEMERNAMFQSLPDEPIEKTLLERSDAVSMIPVGFSWDDVSSWESFHRLHADENNLCLHGEALVIDSRNVTVYNEGGEDAPVTVLGLDDIVVASTGQGVLVCHRSRAKDVKRIVNELKRRNQQSNEES